MIQLKSIESYKLTALQAQNVLRYTCDNSHNSFVVIFMTMLLAHGTLGWFDELIFLAVIILFLVMMFIAWFRSRGDDYETDWMPEKPKHDVNDPESPERFQLD